MPEIPFKQAKEMALTLPIKDVGLVDVYIDDMPPICVNIGMNAERCVAAIPLAPHIVGHALSLNKNQLLKTTFFL